MIKAIDEIPLTQIKGIGAKSAENYVRLGIKSVGGLITHLPVRYIDISKPNNISEIVDGQDVVIRAIVSDEPVIKRVRYGLNILDVKVHDESGAAVCRWFNQAFVKARLTVGEELFFIGKCKLVGSKKIISDVSVMNIDTDATRRIPVYSLTKGISQNVMRKTVANALDMLAFGVKDDFSPDFRAKYGLCEINFALTNAHFPLDEAILEEARRRLVFQELLYFQIAMKCFRIKGEVKSGAYALKNHPEEFAGLFDFTFTNAQRRALEEIAEDITSSAPMNRLAQGDVGSGKTVLAQYALYSAARSGYQAVFMAPTEILARQHYADTAVRFKASRISVGLIIGSMTAKQRREAMESIKTGKWDVIIGTHALIQEDVEYKSLAVVVTDEQHRFGVKQRAAFNRAASPHVLVMSATPIPRTLALILYADLDISVLNELPPGRKKVETYIVPSYKRQDMYGFIGSELGKGRQAYAVCPVISENDDMTSVECLIVETQEMLPNYRIELLHGEMKAADKKRVIEGFQAGEVDMLVSTTVVEVGVNVPNASVMVVENAERFGLAQLHQLRGRVGRGEYQSFCFLCAKETDNQRLKALRSSNDGFFIAERDLQMRGSGQFLGERQHGMGELKIASLVKDMETLKLTQSLADEMINNPAYASVVENACYAYAYVFTDEDVAFN